MLPNASSDVGGLLRYPKIMTEEGIRVVRQWLGATNQLEEGKLTVGLLVHTVVCFSPDGGQCDCSGTTANTQAASSLKSSVSIQKKPFLNVWFPLQILGMCDWAIKPEYDPF